MNWIAIATPHTVHRVSNRDENMSLCTVVLAWFTSQHVDLIKVSYCTATVTATAHSKHLHSENIIAIRGMVQTSLSIV